MSAPQIAIVGSGPSGCFLAQAIRRSEPSAAITIFDKLPVPYGLIRYGVAADHQGTKAITRQFDRLFARDGVRFAGNVEIGRDVSLEQLRSLFNVTVLATGLNGDRKLGISGEDQDNVFGSGQITRLLNAHPDEAALRPRLGDDIVIIGNGNVAIDIVRLLCKCPSDMTGSDVSDVHQWLHKPHRRIAIVGRSSSASARFDTAMVRELGRIPGVRFALSGDASDETEVGRALQELAQIAVVDPTIEVDFHFGWRPVAIAGDEMHFDRLHHEGSLVLASSAVITAIGFDHLSGNTGIPAPANGYAGPETGQLDDDLFFTGWVRRGSQGGIPRNREDAIELATTIGQALNRSLPAMPGYLGLPASVRDRAIDFDGWLCIDSAERAAAPPGRVRRKLQTHDLLLETARRFPSQ